MCDPFTGVRLLSNYEKSAVPYATPIFHCNKPGMIALTFDDGPFDWTSALLDLLKSYDAKATFFITGKQCEHTSAKLMLRMMQVITLNGPIREQSTIRRSHGPS